MQAVLGVHLGDYLDTPAGIDTLGYYVSLRVAAAVDKERDRAICSSTGRLHLRAIWTWQASTKVVPSRTAMSPAMRIKPPSSRKRQLSLPGCPALAQAAASTACTPGVLKCGILPSRLTSWAT